MSSQVYPAMMAMLLGVFLGVVLFVPFVAVQYRRQGRLTLWQTVLWAGFLVYGLALWTYTLLPMPEPASIRCVGAQTTPLQFLGDIRQYPYASPGALVHNPAVMQVVLNILLFVPLGFFLRIIWRRGVVVSALTGLGVSLAIELTQLTGVWGLYSCAYRFFDVDDLIANTAGAVVGGVLSLALRPFLATRGAGDRAPGPQPVTFWRRALGMLCDALSFGMLGAVAGVAVQVVRVALLDRDPASASAAVALAALGVPLVVFGVFAVVAGRTLGDAAVQLEWEGGLRPRALRSLLRFAGGIGGWQVLAAVAPGWDLLFLLASVIALIATPRRGGLPGLAAGGARPVDSRA